MLFPLSHLDQIGIVILSLPGEDVSVIEAGGVALEVPLAEHYGLVSGLLKEFRER